MSKKKSIEEQTIDALCDNCNDITEHTPDEFNNKVGWLLGKYKCNLCESEQQGDKMVVKTMAYLAKEVGDGNWGRRLYRVENERQYR